MVSKDALAILCNLREKSGPKIKYWQSYSNIRSLKSPFLVTLPCTIYMSPPRQTSDYCTAQAITHELKFWSASPLFLEDENIFQKSASVVRILSKFHTVPRRPIFELHLLKKVFFSPEGFSVRSVGAGKLFVLDFPIHPGFIQSPYKTGDFQMPITLSKI